MVFRGKDKGGIHSEVFPASGTDEGDNGILLWFERYVCWSNECEAMHLKSVIIIMHWNCAVSCVVFVNLLLFPFS